MVISAALQFGHNPSGCHHMTVRVIDIETTGTDPETDAAIEIASVVLAEGTITNQVSTLVRPGIPIPPEASAAHHHIDEDLAGAPPLMNPEPE